MLLLLLLIYSDFIMAKSPLERYQDDIRDGGFSYDSAQEKALHYADAFYRHWTHVRLAPPHFWSAYLTKPYVKGLYLWGGVGRGKTYILDSLHASLGTVATRRVHFHSFMQEVHAALLQKKGCANPLRQVAEQWAAEVSVLLVDEFLVSDIADAMLLGGLLKELFRRGMSWVATSNTAPDDLYAEGLQRERFLPAIELIKKQSLVIELASGVDYRQLQKSASIHQIFRREVQQVLDTQGIQAADYGVPLVVNHRVIKTTAANAQLAWFDFNELCETPRAVADYLKIAELFSWVVLSDIPYFTEANESALIRFVHLIDALYDGRVQLRYSAADVPERLYQGRMFKKELVRALSRLVEMSSQRYQVEIWRGGSQCANLRSG